MVVVHRKKNPDVHVAYKLQLVHLCCNGMDLHNEYLVKKHVRNCLSGHRHNNDAAIKCATAFRILHLFIIVFILISLREHAAATVISAPVKQWAGTAKQASDFD